MPPRKTTDFGELFESLIEDLRIQVAASVDRTLSDFAKRGFVEMSGKSILLRAHVLHGGQVSR